MMSAQRLSVWQARMVSIIISLAINILGLLFNGYDAYFQEYTKIVEETDYGTTERYISKNIFIIFRGEDVENIELCFNYLQITVNIAQFIIGLTTSCCHEHWFVRKLNILISGISTAASFITFVYTIIEMAQIFILISVGLVELTFIFTQGLLNSVSIMLFCCHGNEDEEYEDIEKKKLIHCGNYRGEYCNEELYLNSDDDDDGELNLLLPRIKNQV